MLRDKGMVSDATRCPPSPRDRREKAFKEHFGRSLALPGGDTKTSTPSSPVTSPLSLQSIPGVGPILPRTLIGDLSELAFMNQRQAAALVGVAPFNCDSGMMRDKRAIWGGRSEVRSALYMATITAIKKNPTVKTIYDRQRAQSKPFKVALVAAMHQLLKLAQALLKSRQKWNPHLANLTVA